MIPLIEQAIRNSNKKAIKSEGKYYSYEELLEDSQIIALQLIEDNIDLKEERIAFLIHSSYEYVTTQWAIWRAGAIAVPLCTRHPLTEIQYVLEDSKVKRVIARMEFIDFLSPLCNNLGIELINYDEFSMPKSSSMLPNIDPGRRAMILYTSGTTSKPKGVVSTHNNISTQITTLVEAWQWNTQDRILNILPLHHVHGIINILSCALWSGALCVFLPKFENEEVFDILKCGEINLFMAVPTIYYKLIQCWETKTEKVREEFINACKNFRLMVSGSAALPVPILEKWNAISGQVLLERYGMTEIGMAISNPYNGERRPGHIGLALPGVQVKLVDSDGHDAKLGEIGEIHIKSNSVFLEYWNKPKETADSFTPDGWFKTGDMAILSNGYYKILGRNSVDIIKTGGFKISALEIEEVLLTIQGIQQCAVVGLPDDQWGEIVAAAIIPDQGFNIDYLEVRLKSQLAPYKIPRKYLQLKALPRNTLGKVLKNELKTYF